MEYNPSKMGEVDGIMAKYAGKERNLYEAVCKKYLGQVPADDIPVAAPPARASGGSTEDADGVNAWGFTSSWLKPPVGISASLTNSGFLQNGLSTLQNMKDAAEDARQKVEASFDEAIRREEEAPPPDASAEA